MTTPDGTGPTEVPRVTAPDAPPAEVTTRFAGSFSFKDGYPTADAMQRLYDELDFQRGCQAVLRNVAGTSMYFFRQGLARDLGVDSPRKLAIFQAEAAALMLTPNAETVYGTTFLDLKTDGPTVLDVPAGLLGLVDDMWMRPVTDIGPAGPDAGQGGKYLIVPPGYDGALPDTGYFVVPAQTYGHWLLVRAFLGADGSPDAAIALLKQVRIHALDDADAPPEMTWIECTGRSFDTIAPVDIRLFEGLADLVDNEAPGAIDPESAGVLQTLGIVQGEPFAPDDRLRSILAEAALVGSYQAMAVCYGPRGAGHRYPDRQWLVNLPGYPTFEIDARTQLDALLGVAWFATGTAKAMGTPAPGTGSQYTWTFVDANGSWLAGENAYHLRLPANIPARNFWSVDIYDVWTRALLANGQAVAAKNSYDPGIQANSDGTIDILFGPEPPANQAGNWIRTEPGKGWFVILRLYGPLAPWFDATWKPGDIERV